MRIKEYVTTTGTVEPGKISNVKILGYQSKNGRTYTKLAVEKARDLYENSPVYINHSKNSARNVEDKFGNFQNIVIKEDGLFGDLQYLESHPMTPRFIETIEKNLQYFGMSHSIMGTSKNNNGIETVESIDDVESVDLVAQPATTKGLFEQIEEIEPEVIDDEKVLLHNQIKELQEEVQRLKEKTKISEVRCEPLIIENKNNMPANLKEFWAK